MSSEGILFIATGATHRAEAAASARAGRAHAGGRPIAIMTDDVEAAEAMGCFDRCLPHPDPRRSYRDKIPGLLDLPFDRTLFLDSDARPTARLDGLFALLDHHDLAAAQAPVRIPAGWRDQSVPDGFPELNSGVLLLRRGEQQAKLVGRWLEMYDDVGQNWDQATFRSAAWALLPKGLRIATLPPEANLRTTKPWIAGKGIPVTVVHGRVPEAEWPALLAYLNGDIERFRTSTEWLERHRDSALTPRIAAPRSAGPWPIEVVPDPDWRAIEARWPTIEDDPLPCEDPVFVLAAGPRSGSTLLQRMLDADPDLMIWDEPHHRAGIIQGLAAQWRPFTAEWPDERHLTAIQPGDEPSDRSPEIVALRQAHRSFLDRRFGLPAREAGRRRWGLKETRLDAGHAAYLKWLYPGARFLMLVRHPLASYASVKLRGPWDFDWPAPPIAGAADLGAIWSRLAIGFHGFATDASAVLVRYEDLTNQTETIRSHVGTRTIARPGDLDAHPGDAPPRGNDALGILERRRLAAATRKARALLGYARDT